MITKYQKEIMEHCLKNGWFGTGKGKDMDEFEKLVSIGFAVKQKAPSWSGDEVVYGVSPDGKKAMSDYCDN